MMRSSWESSLRSVCNVVIILRIFHLCSGLKINLHKSNLHGIGVNEGEIEDMARRIGCKEGAMPFKYLGLIVGANMNGVCNWRPVHDIFDARLASWKASLLSIGGRLTLIKSLLESIPNYYFYLYKAPVQVIKGLESKIKKFLWGNTGSHKRLHWVTWDRVTLRKEAGGIGRSRLKDINVALLSKWGWRFKTEKIIYGRKLWNLSTRLGFAGTLFPLETLWVGFGASLLKPYREIKSMEFR
ncbi:uncharacterized protein LOC110882980 [Helianthus annuus]|uniref:uncharacterized protein LOC110882980 n=1 Tax=Helianthus annuus TaxID=4232 RepID=UPI000B8FBCB2|nr:uncharacterized protein LOC110882980 [Helianthus annuus]